MKILHVIDSGGLYGAEKMLLNLVSEQLISGMSPLIMSIGVPLEAEKALEKEAQKRGFPLRQIRFKAGINLRAGWDILKFAEEEHFDIIHSHGYKGNILLGIMPANVRKIPVLATLHGWTTTGFRLTKMRLYEWLDSICLARLDKIVFVNDLMLSHKAFRSLPVEKKVVIYNGISNADSDEITAPEIIDFCRQKFTIVAVGRFAPEKNFSSLVKVVGQLVQSGADIQLLLLGDGQQREMLSRLVTELGLEGRVQMPGFVDNITGILGQCQLFVMPSLTEGLPMALLEAMTTGIPIVASRVGGIPEALEGGLAGRLITPGDMEELKEAIGECCSDAGRETLQKYVEHARDRVKKQFTSYDMAKNYHRVYQQLLGENL